MAVDQARRERGALRVDDRRRALEIEILRAADRRDAAVDRDNRVGVENRAREIAAEHQADVPDRQFGRALQQRNCPHAPWDHLVSSYAIICMQT